MKKFEYGDFLPNFTQVVVGLLLGIGLMMLIGCDKEYSKGPNYVYDFSALVYKDQWGIETWGGHQFVIDEQIDDVESFKKCYVAYLKWSGLDFDGMYSKIYYTDNKNVKIKYIGKSYTKFTIKAVDACQ